MVTITQLEYVLAVDSERHFGRAAEKCHVSHKILIVPMQANSKLANFKSCLQMCTFGLNLK